MEQREIISTSALSRDELEEHNRNLECLLAALALKHGASGALVISEAEIRATRGHAFSLDLGLPDGGVRLKAQLPEVVVAKAVPKTEAAPEFVHTMPRIMQ